jgi:hydroxymethylpyrimidine/phosphomethylpyrimidine kinase
VLVPNGPESEALGVPATGIGRYGRCPHVLVTGGHGVGDEVVNRWISAAGVREWRWPRLPGEFHGSGCTLAASLAARLALGETMEQALANAQRYCNQTLLDSYAIADGQRIPRRVHH